MKATGKKAMIGELTIVIGVLLLVVLLIFVLKLQAGFESTDRDICKASVSAQAAVMNLPGGANIVQPDCKTYNVNFYDDHVDIDGKRQSVYDSRQNNVVTKFDSLTNDIVNQVVAEELKGCWYQFLEGKKSLFSIALIFNTQGSSCFICSEINFDSGIRQSQFTGFYNYIKNKTMPNSKMTYYEYIAEQPRISTSDYTANEKNAWEGYAKGFSIFFKKRDPIITDITFEKLKQKYVVFFVREGEATVADKVLTKAVSETYFAYVLPFDSLKGQCDSMMRGSAS